MRDIIDPSNQRILYRVHNDGDVTKGTGREIVGRIHSDGDITKGTGREIVGRIHPDGDITQGTGREIVAHIHPDGDITQGTGRKVIGRVSEGNSSCLWKDDGGTTMFAAVMGIFFVVFGLIFAIFLLPGVLADEAKRMIGENDIEEIVSLSVVLITAFVSSVLANLFVGKTANFSSRISSAYITSYILQVIVIIVMDNLYYHDLEGFVGFMAILIVPALIAVIPALVTSTVCMIIAAFKNA